MDDLLVQWSHASCHSWEIHKVLEEVIQVEILELKGQRKDKINKAYLTPKILQKENSVIKLHYCKHVLPLRKNKDVSEGGASGPEDRTKGPEGKAMALEVGTKNHIGLFPGIET